jgi:hypothetical protein
MKSHGCGRIIGKLWTDALAPRRKGTACDEAETRIVASPLDISTLCVRKDTTRHQNQEGHHVLSGRQFSALHYELHPCVVDFAESCLLQETANPATESWGEQLRLYDPINYRLVLSVEGHCQWMIVVNCAYRGQIPFLDYEPPAHPQRLYHASDRQLGFSQVRQDSSAVREIIRVRLQGIGTDIVLPHLNVG